MSLIIPRPERNVSLARSELKARRVTFFETEKVRKRGEETGRVSEMCLVVRKFFLVVRKFFLPV